MPPVQRRRAQTGELTMLVSVYIPTKNRVTLLKRAIASVQAQTWPAVEIIVVDDGSTDGTGQYLESLRNDPRMLVLRNRQSCGAPHARNMAIRAARGEFVTGLDDDDWFHPERVAAFVARWQALERTGERFSCLYGRDVIRSGEKESILDKPDTVHYEHLFYHNSIGNQVFTRRQYLIRAGLFDEQMPAWQDLDAFMRLVQRFGPARLAKDALYMLDLDPRTDRISVGSKQRIVAAYRRLAAKAAGHAPALRQALYLQAFGPLYGHRLGLADLKEFFSHGVYPRPLKRLAGVLVRQALRP
ncbi:MAG: hypothetical protein DIU71_06270 [Proteobacteria bacterium]|nr:MAG: hypothetical protein DIU71_06270 [Pseudomonadota bacterium]